MAHRLFIVERDAEGLFPLEDGSRVRTHELPVGAMWRCDCHGERGWLIMLPDHSPWCTLLGSETGRPWDVTGVAPKLSVSPSINHPVKGGWHGHIISGTITDGEFNS